MVVDDDPICTLIVRKLAQLSMSFEQVLAARDGAEALALIKVAAAGNANRPDIILLDLNMPVMDGCSFLKAFNALQWEGKDDVSIFVLSSSDYAEDKARVRALGVENYLPKPLTAGVLESVIACHSGRRRMPATHQTQTHAE